MGFKFGKLKNVQEIKKRAGNEKTCKKSKNVQEIKKRAGN
jgi:hypothetical protein